MNLRDELVAAMQSTAAQVPRAVQVKGWPAFYVRDITVGEIDAQSDDIANPKDKQRIARGAARVICDAQGELLFDPTNAEDVALLARQPWPLLRKAIEEPEPGN